MLIISLTPLLQPVNTWNWITPDGTYIYETNGLTVRVNGFDLPANRPLIMANTILQPIPVIELSDQTSLVNGKPLGSYETRIEKRANSIIINYREGESILLNKTITVNGDTVEISIKQVNSSLTLAFWSWYYEDIGEENPPPESLVELTPRQEMKVTTLNKGKTYKITITSNPKPDSATAYSDEKGTNKIAFNYNGGPVTIKIKIEHDEVSPKARQLLLPAIALTLALAYTLAKKRKIKIKPRQPKIIKTLIITGIAIRLLLAPFTMHVWDVTTMQEALYQFTNGQDPYEYVVKINNELREKTGLPLYYEGYTYPPQPLYLFAPTYLLYKMLASDPTPIKNGHKFPLLELTYPDIHLFLLLYKLPIILAEIAIILLLYSENKIAAALYAVNPYPIFISSMWGHFDPIVGLLLLLAVKLINKKPALAGLMYGLSVMKPYTLVLAPYLLIHTTKKKTVHKFIIGAAIAAIPIVHQLILNPNFIQALSYHTKRQMGGANMFNIVHNVYSTEHILQISQMVGFISFIAIIAATLKLADKPAGKAVTILMLTYLLTAPVNNEQYLASILPLIATLQATVPPLITATPILYAVFNSPALLYFTTPLFWQNQHLKQTWKNTEQAWINALKQVNPLILYTLGTLNSLALLAYTINLNSGAIREINRKIRRVLSKQGRNHSREAVYSSQ